MLPVDYSDTSSPLKTKKNILVLFLVSQGKKNLGMLDPHPLSRYHHSMLGEHSQF